MHHNFSYASLNNDITFSHTVSFQLFSQSETISIFHSVRAHDKYHLTEGSVVFVCEAAFDVQSSWSVTRMRSATTASAETTYD